jgi:hypothetical protein
VDARAEMRRYPIRSRERPQPKIGPAVASNFLQVADRSTFFALRPQHAEAVPDEHPTFIRCCGQPGAEVRMCLPLYWLSFGLVKDPK